MTVVAPVVMKLILAWQLFVKNYNEFNENPTDWSLVLGHWWTDGHGLHIRFLFFICKEHLKLIVTKMEAWVLANYYVLKHLMRNDHGLVSSVTCSMICFVFLQLLICWRRDSVYCPHADLNSQFAEKMRISDSPCVYSIPHADLTLCNNTCWQNGMRIFITPYS